MNIIKHLEYFNPQEDLKAPIHIIGCGAIGSTLAEMFARLGIEELHIWDMDTVSAHNIANQMFVEAEIGEEKTRCVADMMRSINNQVKVTVHNEWDGQVLQGYVFLCVDNIDLRRKIVEQNMYNPMIKAMFDFRMRLTDAQHYAADWKDMTMKQNFLKTMQFTHEEAKEATPTSACGTNLSVAFTVRTVVSLGVSNFVNYLKTNELKKVVLIDMKQFDLTTF